MSHTGFWLVQKMVTFNDLEPPSMAVLRHFTQSDSVTLNKRMLVDLIVSALERFEFIALGDSLQRRRASLLTTREN